ncbi:MAG: ribonuclease III [Bacteroidetes bacterium]|nr:ribonuclease III [Bacteroidota bacterium]
MTFLPIFKAYFSADKQLYQSIKNILGFYPGNIFVYKLAFLHKSASQETRKGVKISNERLEYLGDTILSTVVADYLFKKYPFNDEGFLTELRSKIVSRANLNKLSKKMGLNHLIQRDNESNNLYRSIEGDTFEALIGAIYLDKGFNFTHRVIVNRIIQVHLDIDEMEHKQWNFKSKLIDWTQREKKTAGFNVVDVIGNGYMKQYKVELTIDGEPIACGQDYSIKAAEQLAAEKAYMILSTTEENKMAI